MILNLQNDHSTVVRYHYFLQFFLSTIDKFAGYDESLGFILLLPVNMDHEDGTTLFQHSLVNLDYKNISVSVSRYETYQCIL